MTIQIPDLMAYSNEQYDIEGFPLNQYFQKTGIANPFANRERACSSCWNGYRAAWAVENNCLLIKSIHIDGYEGENVLESIFPGATNGKLADWYSGKIASKLSDEIRQGVDGEEVVVERTLELNFQDGILISDNVVLNYLLTPREIEIGLTSTDVTVRRKFAKLLEFKAVPEQIKRGILDEDSAVRESFMLAAYSRRLTFSLSPEELERALTDNSDEVRWLATALFVNGMPSPFQLERGLKDKSPVIRIKLASDFGDQLTPEQIERGLTDEDPDVRAEYASACCFNGAELTPEQIERGLTDEYGSVRSEFINNEDIELSPEQINRGLMDQDVMNRLDIASRYNCDLIEVPTLDFNLGKFYQINGTKVCKLDWF